MTDAAATPTTMSECQVAEPGSTTFGGRASTHGDWELLSFSEANSGRAPGSDSTQPPQLPPGREPSKEQGALDENVFDASYFYPSHTISPPASPVQASPAHAAPTSISPPPGAAERLPSPLTVPTALVHEEPRFMVQHEGGAGSMVVTWHRGSAPSEEGLIHPSSSPLESLEHTGGDADQIPFPVMDSPQPEPQGIAEGKSREEPLSAPAGPTAQDMGYSLVMGAEVPPGSHRAAAGGGGGSAGDSWASADLHASSTIATAIDGKGSLAGEGEALSMSSYMGASLGEDAWKVTLEGGSYQIPGGGRVSGPSPPKGPASSNGAGGGPELPQSGALPRGAAAADVAPAMAARPTAGGPPSTMALGSVQPPPLPTAGGSSTSTYAAPPASRLPATPGGVHVGGRHGGFAEVKEEAGSAARASWGGGVDDEEVQEAEEEDVEEDEEDEEVEDEEQEGSLSASEEAGPESNLGWESDLGSPSLYDTEGAAQWGPAVPLIVTRAGTAPSGIPRTSTVAAAAPRARGHLRGDRWWGILAGGSMGGAPGPSLDRWSSGGGWWDHRAALRRLQEAITAQASTLWSVALAAAFSGILLVATRWQRERRQHYLLRAQLSSRDEVIGHLSKQVSHLNEALETRRRVPVLRTSASFPTLHSGY